MLTVLLLALSSMMGGVFSILSLIIAVILVWGFKEKYHKIIEKDLKEQLVDVVKHLNACEAHFEDVIEYSSDIGHFRAVFDEATQFIAVISLEGTLLYANKALCDFAGIEESTLVGNSYWELPWLKHSEELQNRMVFSFEQAFHGGSVRFEATFMDSRQGVNEIDFVVKPVLNENEEVELLIAMGYNITDLVHTREALTERERQMNALFESAMDGHFFYMLPEAVPQSILEEGEDIYGVAKHHVFTRWNETLLEHFGIKGQELKEFNMSQLLKMGDEAFIQICEDVVFKGKFHNVVEMHNPELDMNRVIELSVIAIRNSNGDYTGSFGVTRDISAQREYEQKLEYYAHKDQLTGLNNRRSFFEKARDVMDQTESDSAIVLMADIDRFKLVNDTYGHSTGDLVLKAVAAEMEMNVGGFGFVGRYGGEEFAVVFPSMTQNEAYELAENLRENLEKLEIKTKEHTLRVTLSMGIAKVKESDENIEAAISRADAALYRAKDNGRNRVEVAE